MIGHSYGGSTAANIALERPGRIHTLITIDPVSRTTRPNMQHVRKGVQRWIHVNAVGGSWHTPSNITAGVGGSWDELPKGLADIFIEAPYNHADFDALIRFSSIRQPSPQNLLNQ